MNNFENHIDDLFKNTLGSGSAKHSEKLWEVLLKKYKVIKFLKFNVVTFNIYYVVSGISIVALLWCYLNHENPSVQNTTSKQSSKQTIIETPINQNKKSELPCSNNEQKNFKQNIVQENIKPTLSNKQNNTSKNNILTDTIIKHSKNNQTPSTSVAPTHTEILPSTQTSNEPNKEQKKEQHINKNNIKFDSVIKYDTTIISKKKVKFKWNKIK